MPLGVALLVPATVAAAACAVGGPDRDSYVKANEALFQQLPKFPGARLREEVSAPYSAQEDGPTVGYTTRFVYDLPQNADASAVTRFYRRRLRPKWQLVEELGPVNNYRNGHAFVSVNADNWEVHMFEIAVDHIDASPANSRTASTSAPPQATRSEP